MEEMEPRLVRLGTAAQLLGLSESGVRRLVRQGELRAVKLCADLRIPLSEIDHLVERKLADAARNLAKTNTIDREAAT
jgi:excisionase family DNA binding protein